MLPLEGMRVVSVEQYGAGPFGTMFLADLGAEVIKVENPADGGDVSRQVGPYFSDEGESLFYQSFNRNKRSLTLNLKRPESREILHKLVRGADAVFNNLRGDQPGRLGLTYADLCEVNPRLVCVHLSAYGREGDRSAWPGYDYLMQAEAGYLSLTGEPDGPPARCGLSLVDYMTGVVAVTALLAGVREVLQTGQGRDFDVSLFDVALHNLSYLAHWTLNADAAPSRERRSAHPSLVPSQLYQTKDGWIFIMCNKEKFWPVLTSRLGRPELASDPRFVDFAQRLANRDELTQILDAAFQARTTADWVEVLGGSVPVAPVNDVVGAVENPFVWDRNCVGPVSAPDGQESRALRNPIRLSSEESPARAAPALGADTESLLNELGYESGEIHRLRDRGVV